MTAARGLECSKGIRVLALAALFGSGALLAQNLSSPVDFERVIRPILSDNCFACHGPDESTRMAGLRLDTREGALARRPHGVAIMPGKPDESLLIRRVFEADIAKRMPPPFAHKTLTDTQKEFLRNWIAEGAPWKVHWSFVRPVRPALPRVTPESWVRNSIDRFIFAKLQSAGLRPAAEADRRSLIRRASLDTRGLPPSPHEIDTFLNDKSPDAYEKMIDRFLASPHYGEHRAHYWLDAARYGDTNGLHYDNYRGGIWNYRDWVVSAFNRNLSYDKFVIEQLAGDLLPNPTLDQLIATGFSRNNVTTNENGVIEDEVAVMYSKDRADTTATVFLGLTVACATCHDHKFDPITQKDHYALEAFFNNTTQMIMDDNRPDAPPIVLVPRPEHRTQWLALNQRRDSLRKKLADLQKAPNPAFETWLRQRDKVLAPPLSASTELLAVWPDSGIKVSRRGVRRELPLPKGVTVSRAPLAAGEALDFDGQSVVELPNMDVIDADKPFSISLWVYVPKIVRFPGLTGSRTGNPVIVSQLTNNGISDSDTDDPSVSKDRGWIINLDQGVPALRLFGDGGKVMRALALRNAPLAERAWTHLTFTYDGSRKEEGLSLYVNGTAVPIERGGFGIQNANVTQRLAGTLKNAAPIRFGGEGNTATFQGSIAGFRIVDRVITEEEAQLLADWSEMAGFGSQSALRLYYLHEYDPEYRRLLNEMAEVNAARTAIENGAATAMVMQERPDSKATAHILFRGLYDQPREEVEANSPSALPPMPPTYPRNRLGLARWLVNGENPLTSRVAVNRFWQEIFGSGIVTTAGDFGAQGEAPSHPELLDWLAVEFRESGWDVKRLLRLILTSATYRQSAVSSAEARQKDPENRLLSRGPRFRLDGEMARDLALSASGLLVTKLGGPPVKPYQPAGVWEATSMPASNTKQYTQDHGEDLYRRSLYTLWKRSAPPASMDVFDGPTRESCVVRRERTDTPLQALVVMNDPQFVEAARQLAAHAMANKSFNERLDYMTIRLLGRTFEASERAIVERSFKAFLSHYDLHPSDAGKLLKVGESDVDRKLPPAELAALTMAANQLFSLDETLNK
ncbi:MAG: hypothetical protein C5B51_29410 [Terriglobia bacterium]|nr:MAG: hypothetical protein C5B51_29410 [Terriglobia bacterium]